MFYIYNCSKNYIDICKTKYDCQTRNTLGTLEQICLTNVTYLSPSNEHFMHISILYIYRSVYNFNEKYLWLQ